MNKDIKILAIESSCDDTGAAVLCGNKILSNVTAGQKVHQDYGGVVPELASRAHQQNIVPVVAQALARAGVDKKEIDAIAFTSGPGLMGSLLVGTSFAKSMALALGIPLVEVNHLQGHMLAHFIDNGEDPIPEFPFLCLTISGGHTQIVRLDSPFEMKILGQTIDDAAGEAFDKIGKVLGLPYPAGLPIDTLSKEGNPKAFTFTKPHVGELDFSFSGLKTNVLYFIQDRVKENPDFIEQNLKDICASVQHTIVEILMDKLQKAVKKTGITRVAIAGGVSANSGVRNRLIELARKHGFTTHIPKLQFTTDNAAMIAIAGYFKYLKGDFCDASTVAKTRMSIEKQA